MDRETQKTIVATLRSQGKSFQEVGNAIGKTRQRASDIAKEPDVAETIRDLITSQTETLLKNSLATAVKNVTSEINRYNEKGETADRSLALKTGEKLLESVGIFKGTGSETVINIINQTNTVISPVILGLMQEMQRRVLEIEDD